VERDRPIPAAFERTERVRERAPAGVRDSGGGGGIARALFAVVLLGGAALAGGLYFGLNQQAPSEVSDNSEPAAVADQHYAANAPAPAAEESVSYEEAALDPPPQIETAREAPRGGPNLPRTPVERETSPRAPDRDVNAAAISGPVPLTPAPVVFVEPVPVASFAPQPAQAPRPAGRISWAAQPSVQRIAALYPSRALRMSQDGSARLDCGVRTDFGLSCTIASESPQGAGFGQAALRAAAYFRVNANLSNGESAVGSRTNVTIRFQGN
jgi:protein TonB